MSKTKDKPQAPQDRVAHISILSWGTSRNAENLYRAILPLVPALLLGLLLRLFFLHHNPNLTGDPLIYGAIARNLLQHGVYGFLPHTPTLIRLPGYPLFLAACFRLFGLSSGVAHYYPVLYLQVAIDLFGCVLLSRLAARLAPAPHRRRAAQATLWLAALCPFTACYTAAPLTETLELFSIGAALYCFARALGLGKRTVKPAAPPQEGLPGEARPSGAVQGPAFPAGNHPKKQNRVILSGVWRVFAPNAVEGPAVDLASPQRTAPAPPLVALSALAWIAAALLRPDGALLGLVLIPALVLYAPRLHRKRALQLAALSALASLLAFAPWTLRNWHTFHVFQPLAPRYATDPGEPTHPGFQRWTKTICADLACTAEVYWAADDAPIALEDLPSRAFDSASQLRATQDLLAAYNRDTTITPALDARFRALADQHIAAHPLRYYAGLPLLRLADMWFRPRVELFNIDLRWWHYRSEGPDTLLAWAFAALNAAYMALALAGACRRPPLLAVFLAFILLRCALLLTLEAPEPRYTLECFPILFLLGGLAVSGFRFQVSGFRDEA